MSDVWIVGAGMTRFGKRDESLPELIAEAARAALSDARIEHPNAIVVAAMLFNTLRREISITLGIVSSLGRKAEGRRPKTR